ncbi:MAG TPA: LysR substrate-binding domain-containing protein [Stellaceae bacterium]|nr:LysR substrate-binding domain-containing protein [Stellaceae bacterium]
MDCRDLRIFEAVARQGGMGRAAAELNTVQSNVTSRIRRLEGELKVALFRRHARGVEPTEAGRRLMPYAIEVARLLREARQAVGDDGTPRGRLVVGSLETTAALRIADKLAAYVAAYPEVDLVLRTGTTAELIGDVSNRKLDGALVCGPVRDHALVVEPMFAEELVLLTAPHMASLDEVARSGEARIVVLRAGCSYRQRLEGLLARRGIPAPRILEFGTLEAIVACVAAGLGITLLPRALIGPIWDTDSVAVHSLPRREGVVETVFIQRRDAIPSTALTAFLATIRARSRPAARLQRRAANLSRAS